MQLAFLLYKYFPFGGMQRSFLRIAQACQARGHAIRVYVLEWNGDIPSGFDVVFVPVKGLRNVRRYAKFTDWVQGDLQGRPADRVIGFNKMPGLDIYFASDPCYEQKARALRNPLYRLTGRYRHFSAYERAVFSPQSRTEILMISTVQQVFFEKYYATPNARFHLLPPGIWPDRRAPANAAEIRAGFRSEFGLAQDDLLLLQIGSGFKIKGLDRSLIAFSSLPDALRLRTRLIVIGQDDPTFFRRQSASLGLAERVTILPGRDDIPRFLLGADLLIHPAYNENTGNVLLEALVAGLPVLATAICGFAHFITDADGGLVVPAPFEQAKLNEMLAGMLDDEKQRELWKANALAFAQSADIYSNAERAADLIVEARP